MEISWARMDGKKGTLVLEDNGIFFQPYEGIEKSSYRHLLGDAVSITQTGVFGAINMHKKLADKPRLTIPEVAKKIRDEKGLKELIENHLATYFSWDKIKCMKKKFFSGKIILLTKQKNKIVISEGRIDKQKAAFEYLHKRIVAT